MELKDCRILITGASAGLGQEFARQLHAQGAHIIVSARRQGRLAALCAELCAQRPGSAEYYPADLSQPSGSAEHFGGEKDLAILSGAFGRILGGAYRQKSLLKLLARKPLLNECV